MKITGCKAPCKYTEYKVVGPVAKKMTKRFEFAISIVSTDVTVKTEELLYPITSFVSEYGGAFGLFLGFSFMMVWDVAFFFFQAVKKFKLNK